LKKIYRVLFLSVAFLLVCGCSKQEAVTPPTPQVPSATATAVNPATTKTAVATSDPTTATTAAPTTTVLVTDKRTTNVTKKATTKAAAAERVGVSENGYDIKTANGITYVDGVMVVNKTYSLPASYNTGDLTAECDSAYMAMKSAAKKAGHTLYISSGFRDYETQEVIYNRYVANDGKANADRYSARPGHSEHQTGLAIDLNGVSDSFGDTAAGKWVAAHCHEYGFILRYPKGKEAQTGYMYEPWHIRYVGNEAAAKIAASGLCLEEYYGITSEYQN